MGAYQSMCLVTLRETILSFYIECSFILYTYILDSKSVHLHSVKINAEEEEEEGLNMFTLPPPSPL